MRLGGPCVRLVLQRLGARQWSSVQAAGTVPHPAHVLSSFLSIRKETLPKPSAQPTPAATPAPMASRMSPVPPAADDDNVNSNMEYELQRERAVREQLQRNMFDLEQVRFA